MGKVKLNILGLSYSQTQTGAYALVLAEEDGDRRIPIIIGGVEAQAIAIQLEELEPPRPLTHDLFKSFAVAFSINIVEVNIYRLHEGIFHSELICEKGNDRVRIDSRTSDAVAIALRFKCPIFTSEEIIDKAGVSLNIGGLFEESNTHSIKDNNLSSEQDESNPLGIYAVSELKGMLDSAIENEDYEKASQIRDELNKR